MGVIVVNTRIPQQSSTLQVQSTAEALLRKEKAVKSDKPIDPQLSNKLDASYELNLSEAAQSMTASALPAVKTPEDARKQLDLIRAAAEKSAGSMLSSHKPNAKSVVDLLA